MRTFRQHVREEFDPKVYKTLNDELHRIAERIKMLEGPLSSNAEEGEAERLRDRVVEIEGEIKGMGLYHMTGGKKSQTPQGG